MEITEEVRRAVYAQDCALFGHQIDQAHAVTSRNGPATVGSSDPTKLPHLTCRRCRRVWLVVPGEGWDYEAAEADLYGVLRPDSGLARQITRNLAKRSAAPE